MKAVLSLLMSVAVVLGGALPGRALHDCAMTGKRGQLACCCRAAAVACPSCAHCEPGGVPKVRDGTGRGSDHAAIHAACCSITHEKSALRHAAPAPAEGAWKVSLESARLAAALPAWMAAPLPEILGRAARGLPPPVFHDAGGAPLFILHCSLTL